VIARHGDRFLNRVYTPDEIAHCRGRISELAARFAAKEAVMKALGTGWRNGVSWTDIEVTRDPAGRPDIRLTGACLALATSAGVDCWHLSLSHAGGQAMASVIGCRARNSTVD
jgi:holo-[acyl-carrier protein] synthase